MATSNRYVPTKSPSRADPALRAYLEREFQSVARALAPATVASGDVRDFGAKLDGDNDDTSAIQATLDALPWGGTAYVPATAEGFVAGGVIVSQGKRLKAIADNSMHLSRFQSNVGINSATKPGGVTWIMPDATAPPVILRSNACVEGFNVWYPAQNWDITAIGESFVAYPPAVQLGDVTEPLCIHPVVRHMHFLGATTMVGQYADDGTSLLGGTFEYLSGVLMGEALRVQKSTEVLRCNHWHFSPNAVSAYVADGTVGGDYQVFNAKCATLSRVFLVGLVESIFGNDLFGFGARHFYEARANMFTGDANEGYGGVFNNCGLDSCYQAFLLGRDGSGFSPLAVIGGTFAPYFRPNADAGDADFCALLALAAGIDTTRAQFVGVRCSGVTAGGEFPAGYTGARVNDVIALGALGVLNTVQIDNYTSANGSGGVVGAGLSGVVTLGNHTVNDVAQGIRLAVIAAGSLPAAGADQDGRAIIEDNGAGDRNLIIYAGGQRFRIDGGGAF